MSELEYAPTPEQMANPDFKLWLAGQNPQLHTQAAYAINGPTIRDFVAEVDSALTSPTNLITFAERMVDVDINQLARHRRLKFFSGRVSLLGTTRLLSTTSLTFEDTGWVPDIEPDHLTSSFDIPQTMAFDLATGLHDADESVWSRREDKYDYRPVDQTVLVYNERGRLLRTNIAVALYHASGRSLRKIL